MPDWYSRVPKGLMENAAYRKKVLVECSKPGSFRRQVLKACSEDILFWVNTFVFVIDPRKADVGQCAIGPFNTYPYQDQALLTIQRSIRKGTDLRVEKSRDMGWTFMPLTTQLWFWLFETAKMFAVVSRNKDCVDSLEDMDALFPKMRFILRHLPRWMLPDNGGYTDNMFKLVNHASMNVIRGVATTEDMFRGGRPTAIFCDEFASFDSEQPGMGARTLTSTQYATNCRIFVSTPKGEGNAFAQMRFSEIENIRSHWTQHPEHAKGLYYDDKGKPRSPWYDEQCKRAIHDTQIKQELDIDYLGSAHQFFRSDMLDELMAEFGQPCWLQGKLEGGSFVEQEGGIGRLWFWPDVMGNPPKDRKYLVSVDIATGSGASNSVASVFDIRTREQVGEFTTPFLSPQEFAKLCLDICRWFRGPSDDGAHMIWEGQGPGDQFRLKVIELGYRNFYYSQSESKVYRESTQKPGWTPNPRSKHTAFGELAQAWREKKLVTRSLEAYDEAKYYTYTPGTLAIEHSGSRLAMDPSGAKQNHGDRVITQVLAWHVLKDFSPDMLPGAAPIETPKHSFKARRNRWLDRQREAVEI